MKLSVITVIILLEEICEKRQFWHLGSNKVIAKSVFPFSKTKHHIFEETIS